MMPPSPYPSVQRRRLALGAAVRARRRLVLSVSQEALAKRAGCDRQSINRVENAAYSPSADRLFRLADALGVTLGELAAEVDAVDAKLAARKTAPDGAVAFRVGESVLRARFRSAGVALRKAAGE